MESLFLLVLSMLAVESADYIQLLYKHFLSKVAEKSLNAFYYACSYAKIDCYKFMNVTVCLTLQIIPEHLHNKPVFLCIDDTMVAKFGQKFENVSKLFDHAAHNGSNYLNGHWIFRRPKQGKEADLQNVENDFHPQKIFLFHQKR